MILLLLIVAILIGFTAFFGLYEVQIFNTKASTLNTSFSVDNSYVFVTPLQASANGQEKIRVTVFVLNNQGLGVLGRKVTLGLSPALNIQTIQGLTDSFGKSYFDVSSSTPGDYYIDIQVDGTLLTQKAHVTFN